MSDEALRLIWKHDRKHTATAYLPPEAAEYFTILTKGKGMAVQNAIALTCLAFPRCMLTLTTETPAQLEKRDKANGMGYDRVKFKDWVEEGGDGN